MNSGELTRNCALWTVCIANTPCVLFYFFLLWIHTWKTAPVSSEDDKTIKLSRQNGRASLRHLHTRIIIPSGHTSLSLALHKVLMNPETYISKQVTRLRQCKRIHKRSRRRPGYPRTNNNWLRGVRLYLQTVPEEETLLAKLCELSEITVSISLLGMPL